MTSLFSYLLTFFGVAFWFFRAIATLLYQLEYVYGGQMPDKNLEVSLISIPNNLLDVIYTACRTCYSADGAVEIF